MKLTKLVLEKFKKVDKVELDLSLAPLNVLVGGNNSGKSSVLESLAEKIDIARGKHNDFLKELGLPALP